MSDLQLLRQIIAESTRYDRTYVAKVLSNDRPDGKVMVYIPSFDVQVLADVEHPLSTHKMPRPNDFMSLYYLNGDRNKPVVRGILTSIKEDVPQTTKDRRLLYKDDKLELALSEDLELILSGNTKVDITGSGEVKISEDIKVEISGDAEVTVSGDAEITVSGDAKADVSGNTELSTTKLTVNNHLEVT